MEPPPMSPRDEEAARQRRTARHQVETGHLPGAGGESCRLMKMDVDLKTLGIDIGEEHGTLLSFSP